MAQGTAKDLEAIRPLVTAHMGGRIREIVPVSAGLGPRRFYRIWLEQARVSSAIARLDAAEDPALRPEGVSPEPELEPVRKWMENAGLPVPQNYARAPGIDLLEDFGSQNLADRVREADSETRQSLYRAATALVPRIQALPLDPSLPSCSRFLDAALIRYKARQVIEWVLPWSLGRLPRPSETEALYEAFAQIAEVCIEAPQRVAHRDFQSTNLLLLPTHLAQDPKLGMIDLQGAFMAPPEYDLVCLLRDAHVGLSETEIAKQISRTRPRLPDAPTETDFDYRFTLLSLSRCGKDLARFLYAATVRNDERFTELVPAAAHAVRTSAIRAAPWGPRLERVAHLLGSLPDTADGNLPQEDSQ